MRLWSLHPDYLDTKGLVALWREALLAQKIILGETESYKNHPQMTRFLQAEHPVVAISYYLKSILRTAASRGYKFKASLIRATSTQNLEIPIIGCNTGQIDYERALLIHKIKTRQGGPDLVYLRRLLQEVNPHLSEIFRCRTGGIESWERVKEGITDDRTA